MAFIRSGHSLHHDPFHECPAGAGRGVFQACRCAQARHCRFSPGYRGHGLQAGHPAEFQAIARDVAGLVDKQDMLQVSDSRPGIAVAERERVFDPFHRGLAMKWAPGWGSPSSRPLPIGMPAGSGWITPTNGPNAGCV
ncbi:hypothetical protein PBOI14_60330 [Pseudomonas sp. Boi14]|nr:hypothetical protein PBOI14_60330 [Pseudomonas sp. Boi14]